ncbi:hypothetical protein [Pseudomonas sp. PS01301]|uniref:hypothetical protein n=1 Tax=Pseudomonas sp. PS01301 TaxID=2991437 RepID=UPI00249A2E99|nr:hypothetical protein [Pseudomonas sp. PS01301]
MVPVKKITLVDRGQDFTQWYVRNGIVIDCQPAQGDVWVGTLIVGALNAAQPDATGEQQAGADHDVRVGSLLGVKPRNTGVPTTLNYPVETVEALEPAEALEVEEFARRWAERLEIPLVELGL